MWLLEVILSIIYWIANPNLISRDCKSRLAKWIKWSGDIDLFFVCEGSGKTTLADMIKAIKIYPNPAKEELNIDGLSMANCKAEMYDILGNLIKSDILQTGLQKINLSNTSKGLYLVKVKDPKGNPLKTIKLIIE